MARTPAEARLLASLETLEKGGDALQDAPHDGGLATEGTNIQSSAKAMKKALRGLMKGGMSRRKAEETLKALYAKSDDASSDDDVAKAGNDDDDSMSSDDDSGDGESAGGGDDESDEGGESSSDQPAKGGKPFGKSHGASQLANASSQTKKRRNESIRKALIDETPNAEAAFDAAPILDKLVQSIDNLTAGQRNSRDKRLMKSMRKSITEFGDNQKAFNSKIAKALVMIVEKLGSTEDLVKAIHDQPVPNQQGSTLRKANVREPQFRNGDTSGIDGSELGSPLENVEFIAIQEALTDMCLKSQGVSLDEITKFENTHDFSMLPKAVVQKLEQKLCSAS